MGKQRTERESSLSQVPKLRSSNLNGEFINLGSLLCASTRWFWSSEGGCDAWAEGMCMLWRVERHPFPDSFSGVVPQHMMYHYRVITDVIIHNEVISEKHVLLIVMASSFIKMRNPESNNAQRMLCGNSSRIGTAREWAESRREIYTVPFPWSCFTLFHNSVSIGSHINYQLIRRTLGFRAWLALVCELKETTLLMLNNEVFLLSLLILWLFVGQLKQANI